MLKKRRFCSSIVELIKVKIVIGQIINLLTSLSTAREILELEYCFAREKEIIFAQQKQSIQMNINDCVEMIKFPR